MKQKTLNDQEVKASRGAKAQAIVSATGYVFDSR